MKIRPAESGASAFYALYDESLASATITEQQDPARLYNLRCSQLPYCPRAVLRKWVTTGLTFDMGMPMSFYVGVGHAVHDTMQKYLALSGKLVADYKCRKCNKWHRLSTKSICCGVPCEYHEVSIDYKGIQGHIDAIFKVGNRYYIVDFKTTSVKGVASKKNKPGKGYVRQIEAYAYLLWKQHGIRVSGVMLCFIPRDDPKARYIWEAPVDDRLMEKARRDLKTDRILHKKTMKAKTVDDLKELLAVNCGGEFCEACKVPTPGLLKLLKHERSKLPIKR